MVNYDFFSKKFQKILSVRHAVLPNEQGRQQCHRLGKIIEPVKSGVRRRGGYIVNKSVCRLTWTQTMSIKRIKSCLRVLNCLQMQLLPRITN